MRGIVFAVLLACGCSSAAAPPNGQTAQATGLASQCCVSADAGTLCTGPTAVVETASLECYSGEICEVYAPSDAGGAPTVHLLEGTCP